MWAADNCRLRLCAAITDGQEKSYDTVGQKSLSNTVPAASPVQPKLDCGVLSLSQQVRRTFLVG